MGRIWPTDATFSFTPFDGGRFNKTEAFDLGSNKQYIKVTTFFGLNINDDLDVCDQCDQKNRQMSIKVAQKLFQ